MGPVSRWAVFNPWKAIGIWLVLMVAIIGTAGALGANYDESFKLPSSESTKAQNILEKNFGAVGQEEIQAKVVFSPTSGTIDDAATKAKAEALFAAVKKNPSFDSIESPYVKSQQDSGASGSGASSEDPLGTAASFSSPVSSDRKVAYATVTFKHDADNVVKAEDVNSFISTVEAANDSTFQAGAAGSLVDFAGGEPPSTELIGLGVAFIILLLMFGALVVALVPLFSAVIGIITGLSLVTIATQFFGIASFAPTLTLLIGLGVGIDYSLFVINRYKAAIDSGREVRPAAVEAVNTSGRAVLFAGTTVIISIAGLFVLRISFLSGIAIATMLGVLMVMLGSLFLLPAVLSLLGLKTFAGKLPWRRTVKHHPQGTAMARYANWLQHRPWLGLVALAIVVVLALPVLTLNQGFPDNSGKKPGSAQRIGYDLLSEGYGKGFNGPFLIAAQLPKAGDLAAMNALAKEIQQTEGVAGATDAIPNDQKDSSKATAALITVYPKTGPQDTKTEDLLNNLRDHVIPTATQGTGVSAYVGGAKAIVDDFGKVLIDALPLFLLIVVGLGILALILLFRAIVVPITGAVSSLLSFFAALGITTAVFQHGWLKGVFGVDATGPIFPFLPIMLFAILFGLSMDYQVFLVSRMQEEWVHGGDNRRSVRRGMAGSGRVVAAAGAIMFSVFISFVFASDDTIKLFGLGLGSAILIDAYLVRLVIVPSAMTVLGHRNWWLPGWLDRILPRVAFESEADFEAEEALIEDIPEGDEPLEPASAR